MKISVDIQSAIGQRTGVGNYTAHLAEALAARDDENDYSFFYFDFKRKGHTLTLPSDSERAVRWCPGRLAQQAWKRLHAPPYDLLAGQADVYHFPNFIIPPLRHGKTVVTIHDLAFLRMPETIEARNLDYLQARIRDTVTRADAIIAVSQFTADELCELLQVPAQKIFVVHEGLCVNQAPPGADKSTPVLERLGLERPFLLSVGTVEPRKNYRFLLDAFDRLDDEVDLVIAGGLGWKYEPLLERIKQSPKADRVHITGYLSAVELASLYTRAELFVYPTLYEGFGFPPLEAMYFGLPVFAAQVPPLPEILGDAAQWVAGHDPDEWAEGIAALLSDSSRQAELTRYGKNQIVQYTWENAAQQTAEVYRRAAAL
jgi:glycosyltransferase involved in cell wall biosynthesis